MICPLSIFPGPRHCPSLRLSLNERGRRSAGNKAAPRSTQTSTNAAPLPLLCSRHISSVFLWVFAHGQSHTDTQEKGAPAVDFVKRRKPLRGGRGEMIRLTPRLSLQDKKRQHVMACATDVPKTQDASHSFGVALKRVGGGSDAGGTERINRTTTYLLPSKPSTPSYKKKRRPRGQEKARSDSCTCRCVEGWW